MNLIMEKIPGAAASPVLRRTSMKETEEDASRWADTSWSSQQIQTYESVVNEKHNLNSR
jgi:hypothetical protein